ncbi:MAG: molybdopterin-dependent oxidoreductase, partial [Rhizobiales bacterium]|nr:molybdopterin-dependent oxidoreductase [Hyphomicrobiales bacterium]
AEGQILGSFSQGIGAALYEEFVYGEDGSFQSGTFADYLVPSAVEVPEPIIIHTETPSPFTPLGAKGLAEGNCMSTPVCIANAVCDALGLENITLPIQPAKLSDHVFGKEPERPASMIAESPEVKEMAAGAGHTLSGQGETLVPASPQEVWRILLDPDKLAAVIPGCRELEMVGENNYRAEMKMGVGPVRGLFEATVKLTDLKPPEELTLSGGLDGPLGSTRGRGKVYLVPVESGTIVKYEYSMSISGKVAAIGGRMLDGTARLLVGQFFEKLVAQISGPDGEIINKPSLWQRLLKLIGVK